MSSNNQIQGNNIKDLIACFASNLKAFEETNPYAGPPQYFHEKAIRLRRNYSLAKAVDSEEYLDCLYAVLTSWGMHKLMRRPKLKEYGEFVKVVKFFAIKFQKYEGFYLDDIENGDILSIQSVMGQENITTNANKHLVGNSKLLHHLFPDLIPPIDNKNVLKFFKLEGKDIEVFSELMDKYIKIYKGINWDKIKYDGTMNTSKLKLIDNAIIGKMLQERENK